MDDEPKNWQQNPDGQWVPAEPIPFYYGTIPRILRWFTRGRWPR